MALQHLPADVLVAILMHLDALGLGRAASVCVAMRTIEAANASKLWEYLARGAKLKTELVPTLGLTWKSLCALHIASNPSPKKAVSLQTITDEFEFMARVCDHAKDVSPRRD